jgi:hypothetical protein
MAAVEDVGDMATDSRGWLCPGTECSGDKMVVVEQGRERGVANRSAIQEKLDGVA